MNPEPPTSEPHWRCEACDQPVDGISDNAEVNERQKCPHCKHWTVVWVIPQTTPPPPLPAALAMTAQKCESHSPEAAGNLTSEQCKVRKEQAAEWFNQMRAAAQ